jgi:LysM repeat protein
VDQFLQHYEIEHVDQYVVRSGDSMWKIALSYQLPYWVLTGLNPKVVNPAVGDKLIIPVAKARTPSREPPGSEGG